MMLKGLLCVIKKWLTLGTIFLFCIAYSNTASGQQTARSTPGGVGYLEYLPPDYSSNPTKTYPLLIFLHGSGETGNGTASDLEKVKANGPPKLIQSGQTMCFTVNGVQECFIVISPQLNPSAGGWWPNILQPFFDYILNGARNYRIDRTRVYLTGLSLGGQGVYIGLGETTDIFAGGAVIAGFSNTHACDISARKIPVWGFHGESDGTIEYGNGWTEFNRIGWCTSPVPTAEYRWTKYPGVGHNAWDKAYTTDHSVQSPLNLYEWLLTKRKNAAANSNPVANAGADKIITLPTNSLSLTGIGSDPDGTIASYAWTKVSGSSATLANSNTATLSLSGLVSGSYVFRLTVTDNAGASSFDDVNVTVNPLANVLPVANAGTDKTVTLPISLLTLSGSATDADGTIASYSWTKVSGGTAVLANITTTTLSLTGLLAGSYVFRLTVIDNNGGVATDDVTVTVNSLLNTIPTSNAGTDQVLTLPTNSLTVSGSGSDADGTITSYTWSKVSGGNATLSNATTATLGLSGLTSGAYVFQLTVVDNAGASAIDQTVITVNPAPVSSGNNLALLKTAFTSSDEGWANSGAQAVDGSSTTRWSSKFSDPQWIYVDLGSVININRVKVTWQYASASSYKIQVSNDATNWTDIKSVTGNTDYTNDLTGLSGAGRYVRMYGITRNTQYGYSIYEFEVYGNVGALPVANAGPDKSLTLPVSSINLAGTGTDADGTISSYAWTKISGGNATLVNAATSTLSLSGLVAGVYVFRLTVTDNTGASAADDVTVNVTAQNQGRGESILLPIANAVTSSNEGWANSGAQAIDRDPVTRWGSKFTDAEWIYVDLGANATITRVTLTWQYARAADYKIQVSNDATKWTDIKTITGNTTYTNDLTDLSGAGRYVRMFGLLRGTQYGYSIYEFEVYGYFDSSTARLGTTLDESIGISSQELVKEQDFTFFTKTYGNASDYSVVIFDRNGKEVYKGVWEQDLFNKIFAEKGLYYYHILKLGKQVDSGKVFIKG